MKEESKGKERSTGRISANWRKDAAKPSLSNTIKLVHNQFAYWSL